VTGEGPMPDGLDLVHRSKSQRIWCPRWPPWRVAAADAQRDASLGLSARVPPAIPVSFAPWPGLAAAALAGPEGPATELGRGRDHTATVRPGVVSPPVLRPRRRNRAKLLLLVDRQGSMAPFHSYVDEVCRAIRGAGRLRQVDLFYFHDTPLEGADSSVLEPLRVSCFPVWIRSWPRFPR